MGKKSSNQVKSGNVVSPKCLEMTEVIGTLCEAEGLVVTDKYAVVKELVKTGSKSVDKAFTRWAKNADGKRCLVVFNRAQGSIKAYADFKERFVSIRTINN